eukprot:TRINITY_DN3498_c0_g1_i1.p1 TRINITY_DN3498_c0_g1~~TRINITY_DN3498_c0_g1_i1.p1  ORF type:complete len:144 (+),score=24.75 TRINITY_DN3498_c0_g1_i1:156-587(+)
MSKILLICLMASFANADWFTSFYYGPNDSTCATPQMIIVKNADNDICLPSDNATYPYMYYSCSDTFMIERDFLCSTSSCSSASCIEVSRTAINTSCHQPPVPNGAYFRESCEDEVLPLTNGEDGVDGNNDNDVTSDDQMTLVR